jgi:hypothetical protein
MKAICCLLMCLGVAPAFAQGEPGTVNLANPSSFGTEAACLADCDQVYNDCQSQCRNTGARLDEPHYEGPDLPVNPCLQDCKVNLDLCKEDCQ